MQQQCQTKQHFVIIFSETRPNLRETGESGAQSFVSVFLMSQNFAANANFERKLIKIYMENLNPEMDLKFNSKDAKKFIF
jgi:hypothetical protein